MRRPATGKVCSSRWRRQVDEEGEKDNIRCARK